jgi:cyanophycinase
MPALRNILVFSLLISFSTLASGKVCESHKNCQNKFFVKNNYLTYFSTHPIDRNNSKISRLVIVVHGALRNGHTYFDDTVIAAKKLGVLDNTIVLAPTFRKVTDEHLEHELYWGRRWYQKWKYGYRSEDSDAISSFAVMDLLVKKIASSKKFPNLKSIVITGHSAGGQFTQRYGVSTKVAAEIDQSLSIVPSNPSSYMYLDQDRYHFSNGNFERLNEIENCSEYNHYIYGPIDRASYMARYTVEELRANFEHQKMIYLMSEEDKGTDSLDRSSEAMTQGQNRFERAKNFFYYIKRSVTSENHRFLSIPSIGHDHAKVYESKEAAEVIFGLAKRKTPSFLYNKIGNVEDLIKDSSDLFVMLGGGKNEIRGIGRFLSAANGGDLLVISGKSLLNQRYTHDFWNIAEELKIVLNSVETISFLDRKAGEQTFVLEKIKKAEAIFFTGGDQSKYINFIKGTAAHREILNKVRQGSAFSGTSAGLAIMGEYIFSAKRGGVSSHYVLRNPHTQNITIEHDFFSAPYLRNLITDTHFTERKREGRLLGFMFQTQHKYSLKRLFGVGIDEQTSLSLGENRTMVSDGAGDVTFYRAPRALPRRQLESLNYGPIKFRKLTHGKTYPHYSELSLSKVINVFDGLIEK